MRMMLIYVPGSKHGTDSNKVAQNPQNKRTTYIYMGMAGNRHGKLPRRIYKQGGLIKGLFIHVYTVTPMHYTCILRKHITSTSSLSTNYRL
jgi:hypothetical protein